MNDPLEFSHWIIVSQPSSGILTYSCGGKDPCECLHFRYTAGLQKFMMVAVDDSFDNQDEKLDSLRKKGKVLFEGTLQECTDKYMELYENEIGEAQ